jgi:hypothetical protein
MLYNVYRKGKKSGHLKRIAHSLTEQEAKACIKENRAIDKEIGDTNYSYHKSPAENY